MEGARGCHKHLAALASSNILAGLNRLSSALHAHLTLRCLCATSAPKDCFARIWGLALKGCLQKGKMGKSLQAVPVAVKCYLPPAPHLAE